MLVHANRAGVGRGGGWMQWWSKAGKKPLRFSFSLFLNVSSGWETTQDKHYDTKTWTLENDHVLLERLNSGPAQFQSSAAFPHLSPENLHRSRRWIWSLSRRVVSSLPHLCPPAASSVRLAPPVQQRTTVRHRHTPTPPLHSTTPTKYNRGSRMPTWHKESHLWGGCRARMSHRVKCISPEKFKRKHTDKKMFECKNRTRKNKNVPVVWKCVCWIYCFVGFSNHTWLFIFFVLHCCINEVISLFV